MKKQSVILVLKIFLVLALNYRAQSQVTGDSDLSICPVNAAFTSYPTNNNITSASTSQNAFSSAATFTCGNFRVYYEDVQQNSGEGFDDPILGPFRRNTFCAVLNYVQSVLNITVTIDIHMEQSLTPNANPANSTTISWAAIGGPIFKPGTLGSMPGYFGGNLYDHIINGVDPDANDYDGHITFNFHQSWTQTSNPQPYQMVYWDDYQNTSPSCKQDLFSIALHEVTHCFGFLSVLGDDGTASHYLTNKTGHPNSFTKFDQTFLWYGDPKNIISFGGNKLVTGTTNPIINTNFANVPNFLTNFTPTTTSSVWITPNSAPNNYKSYDGYWLANTTSGATAWSPALGSMLSHLDKAYLSVYRGGQNSPGFQPRYVMGHATALNEFHRTWTLQEIRMLLTLGYSLNSTFSSSSSLSSGAVSNASLLNTNSPPIRSNFATVDLVKFPLKSLTDFGASQSYPENKPATFTITNTNIPGGTPVPLLTLNTHTMTSLFSDPNSDLIGIYPNSLYGIKGVSTGGNNHNSLVTTSNAVVYTPPPGFYGRAEFGFNLWDGKEKGASVVITIVVLPGTFTIAPGNELLINGSFEDATEVKTASNPTAAIAVRINNQVTELNYGMHQSGGHPYIAFSHFGNDDFSGLIRKESYRYCWLAPNTPPPSISSDGYGWPLLSCDQLPLFPSINSWAMPLNQNNECYAIIQSQNHASPLASTLMNPLQSCKYYTLEFDAAQSSPTYSIGSIMSCSMLAVNSLSYNVPFYPELTYTVLQSIPIDYTVSALTISSTNYAWQHVTKDFVYCGIPTSTVLIKGGLATAFGIDNISLKENTTPPPPLIVTATNSSTLFCPGTPAILTGHAINSSCATTFTWLPMNIVSNTVLVVPPNLSTTYTLFARDGCRTGSAVVSPMALPVGSFTAPPVCIGSLSYPLESILPAGTPTPGSFMGISSVYSVSTNHFIDLRPGTLSFPSLMPGVYNYTYTYFYPNGCSKNYTFDVQFLATPTIVATPPCIFSGQSATLTSQPAAISYTWFPGGSNTSSIVVSPTATTGYDLTYNNGYCSGKAPRFIVNILTPITFTNLPTNTLCSSQTISYLENFLASGLNTAGTWTASGGIGIVTTSLGTSAILNSTLAAGIYTIGYFYSPPFATCISGNQFTISVSPGFALTTNGPSVHCGNINVPSVITASSTASGLTFTWLPGNLSGATQSINPNTTTIYTLVANNGICSLNSTLSVTVNNQCCQASSYLTASVISSGTIGGMIASTAVNQNITITGPVVFSGEFLMAPNVSITIANGGTLTSANRSVHFYACNDMWNGIVVNDGGRVNLTTELDLIEDAVSAITTDGSTNISTTSGNYNIDLRRVVFNKNLVAITIKNYTQTANNASPFSIDGCVFTSRDLSSAISAFGWPNAATLASTIIPSHVLGSPFNVGNYPPINLKSPNANQQPFGVLIQNCGVTINSSSLTPLYYSTIIGTPSGTVNLFDNMFYGIYSINSNVKSYHNVFQYTRFINTNPITQGAGIAAFNLDNNSLNYNTSLDIVSPVNPTLNINQFYDCHIGIKAENMFNLNLQYGDFRSTQSSQNTFSLSSFGNFGIYLKTNRIKNYAIKTNFLTNLRNGVYFAADYGQLHISGTPSVGLYWGTTSINSNSISPIYNLFSSIVNEFVDNSIIVENVIANPNGVNILNVGQGFQITNNTLYKVRRGVRVSGFSQSINTSSNIAVLEQDNPATNTQWCIRYEYNYGALARYNALSGFSSSTINPVSGIYSTMNQNSIIQCNSETNLARGFQFAGGNNATYWGNNSMQLSGQGLALTNTGFISAQGSSSLASDNKWLGAAWTSTAKSTYVDATSMAYNSALTNPLTNPSNSVLWVRNSPGGYIPQSHAGIPAQSYAAPNAVKFVNSGASFFDCPTGTWISSVPTATFPPPANRQLFNESIVNDSLGYSDPATCEINKTNLFRLIDFDTTLIGNSSILYNFYHSAMSGNKGKLLTVEKLISSSSLYDPINTLIQGVSYTSSIENNYKNYYSLLVAFKKYRALTPTENGSLYNLATKCPFSDGAIIYQARTLYNLVNGLVINYEDNCGENGSGSRKINLSNQNNFSEKTQPIETSLSYQLFPNPAVDELYVYGSTESENIKIIITDVNSRQLLSETLTLENYFSRLKLNLLNGIYFVTLVNMNKEKIVKKIIIAK